MKSLLASACCALVLFAVSPAGAGTLTDQLDGSLVQLDGETLKAVPKGSLADKKVLAFYFSAHWCPPCRAFTPSLAETYAKLKKKHPNFELIFVSSDKNEAAMEEYMKWGKMSYPAIAYNNIKQAKDVRALGARGIPYLVVVDADGKELAGKGQEEWVHPSDIVPKLEKILAQK